LGQESVADRGSVQINGLRFRRFRGAVDYPAMVDIMRTCNRVDEAEYNESVEDVAHTFAHLRNCDPEKDMLFAEASGKTMAWTRVFWKDEYRGPRLYISLGFVEPAARRRGLGGQLLRWSESRLREIASGHPREIDKTYHVWTTDAVPGEIALFDAFGYRVARTLAAMTRPTSRPMPEYSPPRGLEIRPARPEQYRAIWDAWEEAYRDHWGYTPRSEDDFASWQTSRLFQPALWKIAWDGDQVAGLVLNCIDKRRNDWIGVDRGYTQNVFVRRAWRRRGLARALLTESIRMFTDLGLSETYLGVDTASPYGADILYQSLGYHPYRNHLIYRKPFGP
jgi:mycothiol synthase